MGKVRTKKPIVPPSFMQDLVKKIASAATDLELCDALEGFDAPFHFERSEERSLYNWVDVLNRIDEALDNAIEHEETVLLTSATHKSSLEDNVPIEPLPIASRLINLCLRATLRLVSNSTYDTKNVYNSVEHLTALLAKDDETVVLLCLEIICSLLHRNPRLRPTRAHGSPVLGNRLLSLSRGLGGREAGLGLIECCSSSNESLPPEGASIRLDFIKEDESGTEGETGSRGVISIDNVNTIEGDEKWLLKTYAKQQGLPQRLYFTLSARYRRAKAFADGLESRIRYARIRLLALTTLAQMQLSPEPLPIVFHNEPELVSELIGIARADSSDGLENLPLSLRVTALKCLTAISNDRQRLGQVLSAAGVASHHGILPSMLRTEVANLLAENNGLADRSSSEQIDASTLVRNEFDNFTNGNFFEALLGLVFALAMSFPVPQGSNSLVLSGTVGTIVPLLGDKNPAHARVVLQGIWALECIIENTHASTGAAAFRDHGGLNLVAQRIVEEVCEEGTGDTETDDEAVELSALTIREESRALYARLALPSQPSPMEALKTPAPSSSTASRGILPHSKWALLRALLRLLLLAHGSSGGRTRELANGMLFKALRRLLARPFYYGGSLFAASATATADIAHAEPTATSALAASGLPKALLKSILVGLPPSGEAIRCIPGVLTAICLAPVGLEEVVKAAPLESYLLRLATPFYGRAMHGDTPVGIGSGLEELKRHVPSLRQEGTFALVAYLKSAAEFVKAKDGYNGSITEAMGKIGNGPAKTVAEMNAQLDKMRLTVAHNAARLGAFSGDIADSDTSDVTQPALDSLLDLRYAPAMAGIVTGVTSASSSSRSAPTASNTLSAIISAIRSFGSGSRHGSLAFKSLFEDIKKDAMVFLSTGMKLEGCWLDGVEVKPNAPAAGPSSNSTDNGGTKSDEAGDSMKVDAQTKSTGGITAVTTAEVDPDQPARLRRQRLQRGLNESARNLRVGIVILSGLSRAPGFPAASWGGQQGAQLGAVIAAAERAARWYLALAYTGVTVEMTDEVDFFCSAKVTAVINSNPLEESAEHESTSIQKHDTTVSAENNSKEKNATVNAKSASNRRELTGVAWSLATFVASAERMYSTLARGLTATAKKNTSRDTVRHTNNVKALAVMIGRLLTMHLVCASALWEKYKNDSDAGKSSAAWDYLRGVLREICSVLFGDPRRTFPALTQPMVLQAFLASGGGMYLKHALHPSELIAAVVAASEEESTNRKPEPTSAVNSFGNMQSKSNADGVQDVSSCIESLRASSGESGGTKNGKGDGVKSAAVDVLDSLGQLMDCLLMCPGLTIVPNCFTRYSDWEPRELHRTAQVAAIEVLEKIVGEQDKLFSTSAVMERVFSVTIPMVHTVSSTWEELQKDEEVVKAAFNSNEELERHVSRLSPTLPENSMLTQLLDMGFTRERATEALRRAGHGGLLSAAEWLLAHPERENGGDGQQAYDTDNSAAESSSSGDKETKDKEMEVSEDIPSQTMEEMLTTCCSSEMEYLAKGLKGKTESIVAMAKSMLLPEFLRDPGFTKSADEEEKKVRPVSRIAYKEKVETLFSKLRPLAIKSIMSSSTHVLSKESAFLAVELTTALDKGSNLGDEARNQFAETIVTQFSYAVEKIKSAITLSNSSVVRDDLEKLANSSQVAAIWMHYGGAGARLALKNKNIVPVVIKLLTYYIEQQRDELIQLSPSATDEEAAKPIEGLTLEDPATSTQQSQKLTTLKDALVQLVAVSLLVLDGFVRYKKSDNFVEYGKAMAATLYDNESTATETAVKEDESKDEVMSAEKKGNKADGSSTKTASEVEAARALAIKEGVASVLEALSPLIGSTSNTGGHDSNELDQKEVIEIALTLLELNWSESPRPASGAAVLALIQLISSLTEDFELASLFLSRDGLKLIHQKKLYGKTTSGMLRTIIRHLVEDKETLKEAMEQEVSNLLSARRGSRILGLSPSTLVASATPLLSRDLPAFIEAVASTCHLRGGGTLEADLKPKEEEDANQPVNRENVVSVIDALVEVLPFKDRGMKDDDEDLSLYKMTFYALLRLSELVELSPTCARAFLNAHLPDDSNKKALHYVLQNCMACPPQPSSGSSVAVQHMNEDICDASRALFKALCSSSPSVQMRSVEALASACSSEAASETPRPGMVMAVAMCISSSLKPSVIRYLLRSGVAISIAKCLEKLDLSGPNGANIARTVLKSLDILGQTASNMPPEAIELDAEAETPIVGDDIDDAQGVVIGERNHRPFIGMAWDGTWIDGN